MNIKKLLDFCLLIGYCALIYWLSSHSTLPMPKLFSFQDKVQHAGAYFIMSLLAWRYIKYFCSASKLQLLLPIIFCSIYGMSDEWHQSFVVGRSSDVWDWLADTVGAGLAMLLVYKFASLQRLFKRSASAK